MKIFLDVGHGGKDPGACNGTLIEKDMNLVCASAAKEVLVSNGMKVKMSRESDTYLSLTQRATMANEWGADYFVSYHFNAGGGNYGAVIHSVGGGEGKELAEKIADKLKSSGQETVKVFSKKATNSNGDYYTVIAKTKMPAVICEPCFIDTKDRELADTVSEQKALGVLIAEGVLEHIGVKPKEVESVAQTVMKLPSEVYIQEINPINFEIIQCDCGKRDVNEPNYFNLGFYAVLSDGKTIPVGNLAINGKIITQAKDNPDWINLAGHKLTTLYTTKDGKCGITKTDSLDDDIMLYRNVKNAVSGIPIIVGGKYVSMDLIKSEGYFGNELYDTWHGFLGIRHDKLVYVAMECGFDEMCWALVALGIYDAIKIDGGGSFILKNGELIVATAGNRRNNNAGVWKG